MANGVVRASVIMKVLNAAHLTYLVGSEYSERGGIMLVASPGAIKSTILKQSFDGYGDWLYLTDLTTRQLGAMRSEMLDGRVRTLVFEEFAKLFARTNMGAGVNIEKHIQAIVAQGMSRPSYEDQMLATSTVRAFVCGGVVRALYETRFSDWKADGFARRFLWSTYELDFSMQDRMIVAALDNKKLPIKAALRFSSPASRTISYNVTAEEKKELRHICRHQPGIQDSLKLMGKILSVLKWRRERKAMDTISEFGLTLQREVPFLIIE